MTMKYPPWGNSPVFDWDEYNEGEFWKHRVRDFEVEQCFDQPYRVAPKTDKDDQENYYWVNGATAGGRKLLIIIQHLGGCFIRPVTGWDD